ncbi:MULTISPECIES: TIM-barrel domain-containing protein [unclassified Streptomyces]|uniref:glycoside hydrolase family 31 protein n=1 Tax=unclassified Streptomyces TaxID=2593676 RepID=UPI0023667972|nr:MULTISPECIES: TIM-barrel domain-containing protein [unclassified Streptomyces]MDF3142103.1 glycoside hydrolase family 31 protein [Streptomyces sp. T21Q-yed]WDF43263.1 glycoside hydrolase family 31 protein [Streptomyces sp. T12]
MDVFTAQGSGLERRTPHEVLLIEPCGPQSVRVRARPGQAPDDTLPGALDVPVTAHAATVTAHADGGARIVNGRLTVEADEDGSLRFLHSATGRELLCDKRPYQACPQARSYAPLADGSHRVEQRFGAYDGERIHGLGQHLHGYLDQKGLVIDLVQGNTVVTIPFLHSSRGYGLLWNNPAMGRVELGRDATRWVADSACQIDYWITAGDTPAHIMEAYAEATGHPPLLPEWAAGFWQSKLRYRTQNELLAVAREYKERGLPLSVMVCDFFHWTHMGDWDFDPADWPDPGAMIKELESLNVKLAVSVWPTVDAGSRNHHTLHDGGLLVDDSHGGLLAFPWPARDHGTDHQPMTYVDATHPAARRHLWQQLSEHYHSLGVSAFWLDACEPDMPLELAARADYSAGPGVQVSNLYGKLVARAVAEGLTESGDERPLSLVRSAWAGSQRYGAALWSGDIKPTFESLAQQIRAGLNVAMSGIPWWHTDIGGFLGGDPTDPAYQEVLVRWFQYGTFSPIMRLHGDRAPNHPTFSADMTGGPNEVWSYGPQAYPILTAHLRLRERLRPYLLELSEQAHRTGSPVMRPLFFGFPEDAHAWTVDDQFLLGPDILVAPVAAAGARSRTVHLPAGARWTDTATGKLHGGGTTLDATAPLDRIPVFVREGAAVTDAFKEFQAGAARG